MPAESRAIGAAVAVAASRAVERSGAFQLGDRQ